MGNTVIHVSELENVSWDKYESYNYDLTEATAVWQIYVPSSISKLNDLYLVLHIDEQHRANRYHREADKQRFILGRAYLRLILSKYLQSEPQCIAFKFDQGKPSIKFPQSNIHFNVSNSGDYVLIAVCTQKVGVDVEQLNPDVHYRDVMEISFSPDEIAYVDNSHNPIPDFYKLWTRKEALLKAIGTGIDDTIRKTPGLDGNHLIDLSISFNENLLVRTFLIGKKHIVSIANYKQTVHFLSIS